MEFIHGGLGNLMGIQWNALVGFAYVEITVHLVCIGFL
jgi:hypothetical protein